MAEARATHWEMVYRSRAAQEVSWYRPHLDASLALLRQAGLGPDTRVIDVGGGASTLVDDLLALGVCAVTVLDLSATALATARARLGDRAGTVRWLAADLLEAGFAAARFDLWHDRAVLHFLTEPAQVRRYAEQAAHAVRPGGHAVIGGFAPDGPERCSGLPVARRAAADIATALGPAFRLVDQRRELHPTPAGATQAFAYALLERV
ncbi:class I SAM-dependent methyltransferase [Fulvimonas yonginensis]|uniref:Class I SAM-dependent methyltransferase n=1 Tax=Fulvimonas yonginensis TaxID=1495200 RepID=A0ABU8JG80_9GAMM